MKPESFDALSRSAGRATSRRKALAILAGGAAAAFALPQFLRPPSASAATGGGKAAAASFQCGSNFPLLETCWEIDQYIQSCGIICPDGRPIAGADGCTWATYAADPPEYGPMTTWEDPFFGGWCAQRTVTVRWRLTNNYSTVLNPAISTPSCCQAECNAMIRRYVAAIDEHEQGHRLRNDEIIARANVDWEQRLFSYCAGDERTARHLLMIQVGDQIRGTSDTIREILSHQTEPPIGMREDCLQCLPTSGCLRCVNGTCQGCTEGSECCPAEHCCDNGWTCCPTTSVGNNGCCNPGWVCCALQDGGGCCPSDEPYCYIGPFGDALCSASPRGAAPRGAGASGADRRDARPTRQTHVRTRSGR